MKQKLIIPILSVVIGITAFFIQSCSDEDSLPGMITQKNELICNMNLTILFYESHPLSFFRFTIILIMLLHVSIFCLY